MSQTLSIDWQQWTADDISAWQHEVRQLAELRDAVVLAHNYQLSIIQDVADHVGDSLALSRLAAASDKQTIVFCGVHFMAETAAILAPDKRVLIPAPDAGCSLADTITAEQLRAWKAEHPGAVVVSYVNTTAKVKAETDICCTSGNAVEVINSIPEDQEILFCPDQFLGAHVRRATGRKNIHVWLGECHVHADISPSALEAAVRSHPGAELLVHPECGCTTSALWLAESGELPKERCHVLSTNGMIDAVRATTSSHVLVATETSMLHQLRRANPSVELLPVNPHAQCPFMQQTNPINLLASLGEPEVTRHFEVTVDPEITAKARRAVERMIQIGKK